MIEEEVYAADDLSAKKRTSSLLFSIFLQSTLFSKVLVCVRVRASPTAVLLRRWWSGASYHRPVLVLPAHFGVFCFSLHLTNIGCVDFVRPLRLRSAFSIFFDPIPATYLPVPYSTPNHNILRPKLSGLFSCSCEALGSWRSRQHKPTATEHHAPPISTFYSRSFSFISFPNTYAACLRFPTPLNLSWYKVLAQLS